MSEPIGTVVSVNVGGPRDVSWGGRVVSTAIWKEPVAGRVAVAGINLAGDDQADRRVHGGVDKAVYAYAEEDIAWWRTTHPEVGPGTFGENLTIAGVDLAGAWVGERWAVGDDGVVLEVSEPRLPCFKLGIRMGDAGFKAAFEEADRLGTYLRIVEPGTVGAGDEVRLLTRPDDRLTVAELATARHGADDTILQRVAVHPSVPESWRQSAHRALGRG